MKNESVYFENAVEVNNENYIFDNVRNCFMTLDFENMTLSPVAVSGRPNGSRIYPQTYGKLVAVKNQIYAIPSMPTPIISYDIVKNVITYIEYEIDYSRYPGLIFSDACLYGDYLYFIPCCYGRIIKLNTLDNSIGYISLDDYYNKNIGPYFSFRGHYLQGETLFFCSHVDNRAFSINLNTEKISEFRIFPDGERIEGIVADDDYVWAIPMKSDKIYKLNKSNLSINCIIESFPDGYKYGEFCFSDVISCKNNIYMLPREANMALRLSKGNDTIEKIIDKPNASKKSFYGTYCPFSSVVERNDKIYILEAEEGIMHILDSNTKYTSNKRLQGNANVREQILSDASILNEDGFIGLDALIRLI